MAVQTLELQISDNAAQAASNVNKLASAMQRLQNAVQLGGIKELASRLQQISGMTGVGALGQMAESISSATRQMETFSAAIERATSALSGLRGGGAGSALGQVASEAKAAAEAMQEVTVKDGPLGGTAKIESTTEAIERVGEAAAEAKTELTELSQAMKASGAWQPGLRAADVKIDTIPAPDARGFRASMESASSIASNFIDRLMQIVSYGNTAAETMKQFAAASAPSVDKSPEAAQELADAQTHISEQTAIVNSELQQYISLLGSGAWKQDEFTGAMDETASAASVLKSAFKGLKDVLGGVVKRIGGLFSSFARIARFRLFRTIIRAITTAFKEGMENVREYSKAINGLYAKDMAGFDNAVMKMKNSLGASLAVAFQSLLPIIHQFINAIIDAANVFNQFIALLNGHGSWTKAVDVVASDFEDAKKNATGAAKAAKNLLASWDELNIIQSQSNGGGSGSNKLTAEDYKKMFEESFEFEGWIKDTVDFMESHLPIVQGLLAGIAGLLLGIKDIGVITVAIGLVTTIGNAKDIAKNGFTMENVQTAAIGALEMALGGAFLGAKSGIPGGVLIGVVTGLAVGAIISLVADFKFRCEKGEIGKAIADGLGITAASAIAGAALGMVAGQPLIGAVAGAAVGVLITLVAAFTVDKNSRDGYIQVTEKELQDYVAEHMFESDVRVTLRLINTAVKNTDDARQAIADDLGNMTVPLHGLQLGINKEENFTALKEEIFGDGGLIDDVKAYAKSHLQLIETNIALMPIDVGGMNSAELLAFGQSGWKTITDDFNQLGNDLSKELNKGFVKGIAQFDEEAVQAMTVEMAELAAAMAQQTAISTAMTNLQLNLASGKMTAAEAMAQYAKELETGMLSSELQMAAGFEAQAAYYTKKAEFHPEEAKYWLDMAQEATDLANEIRLGAPGKAQEGVAKQMQPAYGVAKLAADIKRDSDGNIIIPGAPKGYDKNGMVTPGTYDTWLRKLLVQLYGAEDFKIFEDLNFDLEALLPDDVKERFGQAVLQAVDRGLITGDNIPAWVASTASGSPRYSIPEEPVENPQIDETNERLGRIETNLTALRQKEWNVYITPSTALGRATTESVRMWERANGATSQTYLMK